MKMKRPWWRLRESTAASSESQLQRGGANPGGVEQDADADYDADGAVKSCPDCEYGMTKDGDVCPTCKGAGAVMRESGSPLYFLRESVTAAYRKEAKQEGNALADESYPIKNKSDLKDAATLAASGHGNVQAARRLITRRAKELGVSLDSLPGFGKAKESEREKQLLGLIDAMTVRLREAGPEKVSSTFAPFSGSGDAYEVVLIREGKGNSADGRWYTRDAISELVSSGVCEGMQAYSDHPSLDEEEFLPERSVRDIVGSYRNVHLAESKTGLAEARATFVPIKGDGYEWITTLAENAIANNASKPLVGISLYGAAAGDDRERPDGSFGPVADLVRPTSGDIVTNAGAGGQFVKRLMESARAMRAARHTPPPKGSAMKLKELQAKMTESAKRLREAGTDEERTKALDELDGLAKAEVEHEEQTPKLDELKVETLKESEPLWTQIREAFKPEIDAAAEKSGDPDSAALKAENERLKGELDTTKTKLQESERKNQRTDTMFTGAKVLREAKVPEDEHEFFFAKFREANATDEEAMKDVVRIQQEHDERREARMRESLGIGFVEGNPGSTGAGGDGLITLDGVPKVDPAEAKKDQQPAAA